MTYAERYAEWKKFMDQYRAELAKKPASNWAKEAVDYVKKEGIMNGDANGQFRPQDFITREEVAAIEKNKAEKK